jgi:hypothetical protein
LNPESVIRNPESPNPTNHGSDKQIPVQMAINKKSRGLTRDSVFFCVPRNYFFLAFFAAFFFLGAAFFAAFLAAFFLVAIFCEFNG